MYVDLTYTDKSGPIDVQIREAPEFICSLILTLLAYNTNNYWTNDETEASKCHSMGFGKSLIDSLLSWQQLDLTL